MGAHFFFLISGKIVINLNCILMPLVPWVMVLSLVGIITLPFYSFIHLFLVCFCEAVKLRTFIQLAPTYMNPHSTEIPLHLQLLN